MEGLNAADGYLAGFDSPSKVWYILARSRKLVLVESLYEIIGNSSRLPDHHISSCYDPSTNEAAWFPATEFKNPLT
jgi:hypothetical protein